LIVDDNSPDGTGAIADELALKDNRVEVLHRTGKMGLGSAYVHGIQKLWIKERKWWWPWTPTYRTIPRITSHDPIDRGL